MKKFVFTIISLSLLASCSNKTEQKVQEQQEVVAEQQVENTVRQLPEYHFSETDKSGVYEYVIDRISSDSLGVVTDDAGVKYANTSITLEVRRNGGRMFHHQFTKSSFSSVADASFLKNALLDGCRFMYVRDGKVVFSMCISYPDSDMSQPFLLTISPDGSYTLAVDENFYE